MYDSSSMKARLTSILDNYNAPNKIRDMVDVLCTKITQLENDKAMILKDRDTVILALSAQVNDLRTELMMSKSREMPKRYNGF